MTTAIRTSGKHGALLIAGILMIATTLRVTFTGAAPLLDTLRLDYGLSTAQTGLLTTLPLLAFALISPLAAGLARRIGMERSLFIALLLICAGIAIRSLPSAALLFIGTAVIGCGIALGNVLLPGLIKRDFPGQVAKLTGAYSLTMGAAAALGSALIVPLAQGHAGWQGALLMLMVPPQYAVWIPGQMPHSNRATPGAQLCFLFIEPGAASLPERCCTLKISPLVRELILSLAEKSREQLQLAATSRLVDVLFDELPLQRQEHLQLPVSPHPKIRLMSEKMAEEPAAWQTLAQWASHFAMSERNLARLVVKETGLSFRRWRHQLQLIVALQHLISGKSVQQVAQSLGYDSTTAFITMFRKGLGQTPARYMASLTTTSQ